MYKLTYEKRVWIVKQFLKGVSPSRLALAQKVHRSAVYQIISKYKEDGWDSLKDHKTGRPEEELNRVVEIVILDLRRRFGYGAVRIEQLLKNKGFGVSHRQIEKVLNQHNLVMTNVKKQKARKWVRYELENPNDLWHTDWSYDPFTQQQLSVFIDDRTRLITSYGIFKSANAEHSIALLKAGIACFGKPKSIMTDHGSQYYANHPGALQTNTIWRQALDALGIKHYVAPVNRPQTNGKVERFFLTYKTEYATGTFHNIKEFIDHYNNQRPHMSLQYKTPSQIWNQLRTV
jgi:putative transposase